MFLHRVKIPDRQEVAAVGSRAAYVASGSLPFQVAGYAVCTHQLLMGLVRTGVDCVCFTRPGYPWDRP